MTTTTHTAHVTELDTAVVRVRLYDERTRSGARYSGRVLVTDCEMRPSDWREIRHALAVGLAMTGGHLDVTTYHSPS